MTLTLPPFGAFLKRMGLAATVIFASLHGTLVAAYYLVRVVSEPDHWLVDALSYVLPWLLLTSLIFLPGSIVKRSRVLLAICGFPLVIFLLTYGPLYLPRLTSPRLERGITVMSYNIFYRNSNLELALATIEAEDADVVALQEATPSIAETVGPRLRDRYPYQVFETEISGQGLLSRLPLEDYREITIGEGHRPIVVQYARVSVQGRSIGLLNAHPHSPGLRIRLHDELPIIVAQDLMVELRDRDMQELLLLLDTLPAPLVLLGDFNLTDQHSWYEALSDRFIDSHRQAGWGMGFTRTLAPGSDIPMWRIDFIFHTHDLVSLYAQPRDFGGSDHRPVVAELAFRSIRSQPFASHQRSN